MSALIRPTLVYLDTANLIRLADSPEIDGVGALFGGLIDIGAIVPLFSYCQFMERLEVSEQTLCRMDLCIAPMIQKGQGRWVQNFHQVQKIEIARELRRQGFDALEPSEPVIDLHDGLMTPDKRESAQPNFSFVAMSFAARKSKRRRFSSLGPSFVEYQQRHRLPRNNQLLSDDEVRAGIAPYLPPEYEQRFPANFVLDRTRMPFIDLMFGYFGGSRLSGASDSKSDFLDILHLAGIAYANVGFVDKKTHDRLRRGRVMRPGIHRNGQFTETLNEIGRAVGFRTEQATRNRF